MISLKTTDAKETFALGSELSKLLKGGEVILLTGPLGSGKTTFIKGLAKGLGIKTRIVSPTFVMLSRHKLPNKRGYFYHLDLYRMRRRRELLELGLPEILKDKKNIAAVEWPEKGGQIFPNKTLKIKFTQGKHLHERKIQIK